MESKFVLCYPEPGITCGLSDIYALHGKPAELAVKMNMDCDGTWFKDGEQVKAINKTWSLNFVNLSRFH